MRKQDTDFPVAQLMERYDLVRSQVYARINALKAKNPELAPFKIGVKSYVSEKVLGCLDEIHRLINDEGLTTDEAADIVAGPSETNLELTSNKSSNSDTIQTQELFGLTDVSPKEAPIIAIRRALQTEPLARYEMLDKIADRGWRLPTSELTILLGMQTLTGEAFERYGYRFTCEGKDDTESIWSVEKL